MFQNIFVTMGRFETMVIDSISNIISFCTPYVQAYIETLSMGVGEAPLWSLLVTLILFVEVYRLPMALRRTVFALRVAIPREFAWFKKEMIRIFGTFKVMTKPRTTVPTIEKNNV